MKKLTLKLGVMVLLATMISAASVDQVLKNAREDYYKGVEVKKVKPVKEAKPVKVKEIKEKGVQTTTEIPEYQDYYQEEKPTPKTGLEKLESNVAKANERVDFYERVVRSVAREEVELKDYKTKMNTKKVKAKKK